MSEYNSLADVPPDTIPPGLERLADLLWETAVKIELRKRAQQQEAN